MAKSEFNEWLLRIFVVENFILVLTLSMFYGFFIGDTSDVVDVKDFGTKLCNGLGLQYDHRDFIESNTSMITSGTLRIFCVNETEKKLIDSVVIGGN